jgi:hypothetical protein
VSHIAETTAAGSEALRVDSRAAADRAGAIGVIDAIAFSLAFAFSLSLAFAFTFAFSLAFAFAFTFAFSFAFTFTFTFAFSFTLALSFARAIDADVFSVENLARETVGAIARVAAPGILRIGFLPARA